MSGRAAWRLETLGYSMVYRYAAGKADWLSSGLPSEGQLAAEPRVRDLARKVSTCRLGQRIGDLHVEGDDVCVVVNDEGIVLGDLRGKALRADPLTPVDRVMNPGPSTYRPNVSVHEMAHDLLESGARRVIVSDADGRLIGLLRREDVLRAVDERARANGPILASSHG